MSKRTEMFARIAAAMPEDAEVQEWLPPRPPSVLTWLLRC